MRYAATLLALCLFLPLPDAIGDDDVRLYEKHMARVIARQRAYEARELSDELRDAHEVFIAPWKERGGPDAPKVMDYDFSAYDRVWERMVGFDLEKGLLAAAVARAGGVDAAERLAETLFDTLEEISRQEQVVRDSKPKGRAGHDQIPGMKLYGARLHRDALVAALGSLGDAHARAFVQKEGFDAAESWDRKRRCADARVAMLDAMGAMGDAGPAEFVIESVRSEDARVRIAAIEAIEAMGLVPSRKALLRDVRDRDPCRSVRRAAESLLSEEDVEGAGGGTLYFGMPIRGERPILVLESSRYTVKPADVDLMKEKSYYEWRGLAGGDRGWASQLELTCRETLAFLWALPESSAFNIVALRADDRATPLSPKKMVDASRAGIRRAGEFLDDLIASGWAPQVAGIDEAYRLAGVEPGEDLPEEPGADVVILVSAGVPHGGPILYAPALVDQVRRRFRFARIPVHTVRLDDCAAPADELMKGIAVVTGGEYTRCTSP